MVFTKQEVLEEVHNKGRKFGKAEANYVGPTFRPLTDAVLGTLLGSSDGLRVRLCKNCVFFLPKERACVVVAGDIDPMGSSRFFLPKPGAILLPKDSAGNKRVTEVAYPLGVFLPFRGKKE